MKINVLRDYRVLDHHTTQAGNDCAMPEANGVLGDEEVVLFDDLAARRDQPLVEVFPDWRVQA